MTYPYRGHDGAMNCAHVAPDSDFPFLNTGHTIRGVDAAWFTNQLARNYCHLEAVSIGGEGVLASCPNGLVTLFWYDQPRPDAPLYIGSWIEWVPPGGPIEVSADYEEGAVPESGLPDEELRSKLLEAAERRSESLHQDPEFEAWFVRTDF